MNIRFIKSSGKKKILDKLEEQFGISSLPYLLIQSGKEKIRFFSGHLSKSEILKISEILNVEFLGLYAIKEEGDFRITLDALHLLHQQISKNIVEINEVQLKEWLLGQNLQIEAPRGTLAIKHKGDFVGSGKSSGSVVFNYLPKERRLKK